MDLAAVQVHDRPAALTSPPPDGAPPTPSASFRISDALAYGWTAYWRNVGPMVLIALAVVAVNLVLGQLGRVDDSLGSQIALQGLSFVVGIVLAMGLVRASLAVCNGERPEPAMLLQTDSFGAYLRASLLFGLAVAIVAIVPTLVLDSIGAGAVGLGIGSFAAIAVVLALQLYGYVVIAEPGTGAIHALIRSYAMTRGHRWQLFGLVLMLGLVLLAGLAMCFVGVIFSYGIVAVTLAYTYRALNDEWVAGL